MYIKRVDLNSFRNYERLSAEFHRKVNLLVGKNAQGKTNLIEAVYLSALGKSFRTGKDSEMIRFEAQFAKAVILADKSGEEVSIEIFLKNDGKEVKKNGRRLKRAAELSDNIYVVVFSPEDLRIVKDEPEKRRKFIDRELCLIRPVYYDTLSKYRKVLQQRNRLLKEKEPEAGLMEVWDLSLSGFGEKIMSCRKEFIKTLNEISREIHREITDGKETLEISYDSNIICRDDPEIQRNEILEKLKRSRNSDRIRGMTGAGPHKDDLKLMINGVDIRRFGSQGQQRTAALSLKLAEIKWIEREKNEKPVLLLDDVLSELDKNRQKFLIRALSDVQIFITATEISPELSESIGPGKTFYVAEGSIS